MPYMCPLCFRFDSEEIDGDIEYGYAVMFCPYCERNYEWESDQTEAYTDIDDILAVMKGA